MRRARRNAPAFRSPVLNASADLWNETCPRFPGPWGAGLAANLKKWLWTYHEDAVLASSGLPLDLPLYLRRREYSVGMPWLHDLAALDLHPLLPAASLASPAMRALRRAASLHSGLVNDLYSANREAGTGYPANAVLIIEQSIRRTRQEAADAVNGMITELAHDLNTARAALPAELSALATPPHPWIPRGPPFLHRMRRGSIPGAPVAAGSCCSSCAGSAITTGSRYTALPVVLRQLRERRAGTILGGA
ncbi:MULTISPECIES: terpene synthase family protein [unclassified Streptomyces]|uniref:terpene synthase family protein n=1 Tax=unclassified Streptomyces TaxID=2593676 RepID=UPI00116137D5|nr:terpene synthase family protein [Streptomyces sp. TSRI0281]